MEDRRPVRINEKPVAELVRAAFETGADVFARTDGPFDAASLYAFAQEQDGDALILMPGRVYPPPGASFPMLRAAAATAAGPAFADVRILADGLFTETPRKNGALTLALPFAECAFVTEHGYRAAYRMIGELRAAGTELRVAALLAGAGPQDERLREVFGSPDAILLGETHPRAVPAARFYDARERDAFLLHSAELSALGSTVILFPSRAEAERFARLPAARGMHCGLVHGGLPPEENENTVAAFAAGDLGVLLATKHILPSAPFLKADRAIFAGLPFSPAHLNRCAALCGGEPPTVFWCEADLREARRLSEGFARAIGADLPRFMAVREDKLRAVLGALRE